MRSVVRVCWAEPDAADEPTAGLDRVERARLDRLRRPADRARFVTSRALLKGLVASLADVTPSAVLIGYGCPSCGADHGKPYVTGPSVATGWQVSLAHAGERVLVAAARGRPVGVDVEPNDAVAFDGFATVALTTGEARTIEGLAGPERLRARASAWVRKEAWLKASGAGLTVDPRGIESASTAPGVVVRDLAVGPGYSAAVAVLTSAAFDVECCEFRRPVPARPGGQAGAAARPARATDAAAR